MTVEAPPSPWRSSRFRWFAAGNSVNNIGEAIYDITLPLVVYDQTGSVWVMGVVAALIPATLLLGPILGAIADAHGSGRLVVIGLWVQLVAAVALVMLVTAEQLDVVAVIVLAAILQVAGSTYRVGWITGIPGMFPETPVRARGTLSSLFVATTIVGPLLFGALLPILDYSGLLWLDCVSFLAPLIVYAVGIRPLPARHPDERVSVWRGVTLGTDVLRRRPVLLKLTLVLLPFDFVVAAAMPTLVIYHLRDTLGISATSVAWIFAIMNAAALVGALGVSERKVFRPSVVVAWITVGLATALVGASVPVVAVVVVSLVLLMLLDGASSSAQSMMTVHYIPQEVYGRVSGLLRLVHGVPAVLGPVTVGALVPVFGTEAMFVILAVVMACTVATLVAMRHTLAADIPEPESV